MGFDTAGYALQKIAPKAAKVWRIWGMPRWSHPCAPPRTQTQIMSCSLLLLPPATIFYSPGSPPAIVCSFTRFITNSAVPCVPRAALERKEAVCRMNRAAAVSGAAQPAAPGTCHLLQWQPGLETLSCASPLPGQELLLSWALKHCLQMSRRGKNQLCWTRRVNYTRLQTLPTERILADN